MAGSCPWQPSWAVPAATHQLPPCLDAQLPPLLLQQLLHAPVHRPVVQMPGHAVGIKRQHLQRTRVVCPGLPAAAGSPIFPHPHLLHSAAAPPAPTHAASGRGPSCGAGSPWQGALAAGVPATGGLTVLHDNRCSARPTCRPTASGGQSLRMPSCSCGSSMTKTCELGMPSTPLAACSSLSRVGPRPSAPPAPRIARHAGRVIYSPYSSAAPAGRPVSSPFDRHRMYSCTPCWCRVNSVGAKNMLSSSGCAMTSRTPVTAYGSCEERVRSIVASMPASSAANSHGTP